MATATLNSADDQLHVFSTFLGLPPDSETPPVCGATLTSSYAGRNKPHCQECERILAAHNAKAAKAKAVEAYGVKGMKSTPWRKTFKTVEALNTWVETTGAEVLGTREAE